MPDKVLKVPTVDTKPAVGVYSGAVVTLGLSLANRYTPYHPTVEEAGAILIIVGGFMMWLIPARIRRKLDNQEPADDAKGED